MNPPDRRFAARHTARWARHNLAEVGRYLATPVRVTFSRLFWLLMVASILVGSWPSTTERRNHPLWWVPLLAVVVICGAAGRLTARRHRR